jgi:Lysylphosphatidylglycerol synthase TM region
MASVASRAPRILWRALPYAGTIVIFAIIFRLIPIAEVAAALAQAPVLRFFGVFLPFCAFYWLIDSFCLTWVVSRFNAPMRLREMMPIRASMYLLSMINTNLGQGGVAWYIHRKTGVPFLQVLGSILLIGLMEIYQLFVFSTLGVVFYSPSSLRQREIVHVLRITYVIAWLLLAAIVSLFALARRSDRVRKWIETSKFGTVAGTFLEARPLDYVAVLGIKSPGFLGSLLAQHFALAVYGISIPFIKLVLFLPLVFLAAALPIGVAHLGTSQAAWILFFSGSATQAEILAYSLAAHFTFMFCNGLIGLFFLPRANRDLIAVEQA